MAERSRSSRSRKSWGTGGGSGALARALRIRAKIASLAVCFMLDHLSAALATIHENSVWVSVPDRVLGSISPVYSVGGRLSHHGRRTTDHAVPFVAPARIDWG